MAVTPLGAPRTPARTEPTADTSATPTAPATTPAPGAGRTDTERLRAEAQSLGLPPTATREQVDAARARQAEAVMAAVPANPPDPAALFGLGTGETAAPAGAGEVDPAEEPDLDDWQLTTKPTTTDWSKFLKELKTQDPARATRLERAMAKLEAADPFSVFDQRWDQLLAKLGPEEGRQLDDDMFQFRFPGKERPVTDPPPTDPGTPVEPPPWQGEEWQLHVPPNADEFADLMKQVGATDPERVARYEAALARFEAAEPVSVFSERWEQLLASLPQPERQQLDDQMFQFRFPGATRPE